MKLTRKDCIEFIRNLPDHRLEGHGIRVDHCYQLKDSLVLKAAREEFYAKARWLEYLWLDRTELSGELTFTRLIQYKPFADRTCAFLDLAQELYPRLAWAQEQKVTPLRWTIGCEMEICETKLFNSGYTNDTALHLGKVEAYRLACKHYGQLEDTKAIRFSKEESSVPPIQALEESAAYIAASDIGFRNSHYRKYLAAQRNYHRNITKSSLNVIRVGANNSTEIGGKGLDAKPRGKRLRQSEKQGREL
jgi:hypothetical protein